MFRVFHVLLLWAKLPELNVMMTMTGVNVSVRVRVSCHSGVSVISFKYAVGFLCFERR